MLLTVSVEERREKAPAPLFGSEEGGEAGSGCEAGKGGPFEASPNTKLKK